MMRTQCQSSPPRPSSVTPVRAGVLQRKCACGGVPGPSGECEACSKKRTSLQRSLGSSGHHASTEAPAIVHQVLRGSGRPLDASTRAFLEPRLGQLSGPQSRAAGAPIGHGRLAIGSPNDSAEAEAESVAHGVTQPGAANGNRYDLSHVRVHADDRAAASAQAINANAYTVGRNVVFGAGQYVPNTATGLRLIAHEVAHVAQQEASSSPQPIRRDGMGDVHMAEACIDLETEIRKLPAYGALNADQKKLAEEIITELSKKKLHERYALLTKLKLLFDTPVKAAATVTTESRASTAVATKTEKARLAKPAGKKQVGLEEAASAEKKRVWTPIKGKFGGGTYYVDKSSATSIVLKADIHLTPKGTGTAKDVDDVKAMEDGIEKAASNKGYVVDIRFVNAPAADTFKVDVDPSVHTVATIWSGGDPVGLAHELHHMFAFELDRYDYTTHADNQAMGVADRVHWFREELKKPANWNDPTSIMDAAQHPNDDDACRVAGLDVAVCVPARAAARKAGKL